MSGWDLSVVLTQRYDGEALCHHLVRFLVSHHGGLGPEHHALTHHLANDPQHGRAAGQRLSEKALPAGDGFRDVGAWARNDDQPAAVCSRGNIDALIGQGIEVTVQVHPRGYEKTGLPSAEPVGQEGNREPEAAEIGAVDGSEVSPERNRGAAHVYLRETRSRARRVARGILEEAPEVLGRKTPLATTPDALGRQQAGVAPAANRRFAHSQKLGGFLCIEQTITSHDFAVSARQHCRSLEGFASPTRGH
jgi:hypothetical protein